MKSMNTSEGRAVVIKVHSVPAPFINGVVVSREENKKRRYSKLDEAIRYTSSLVGKHEVVTCSPTFKDGDSHGRWGRKLNKRSRGNLRWTLI